jgi:anti-sigma regulatory factor (Ser/Thr protein kinase)
MALGMQDTAIGSGEHVVHFYEHDTELVAAVGPYLIDAAQAGEVAVVIATEAHRRAFESELEAAGIDVAEARDEESYLSLDAADTMAAFMPGGEIDRDAFHEVIGGLVRKAARSGRAVRAYGEMVALLWDAGSVIGAIELEGLWNELAHELPFALFCSYPAASVLGSEHAEALHQVCHLHTSVVQTPPADDLAAAERFSDTEVAAKFPAGRDAPGRARRLLAAALRQWGYEGVLVDCAVLVSSELGTNAVLHADSPFSLTAWMRDSVLRIAVEDASPLGAPGHDGGLIPQAGHGLAVVETLAASWGVEGTPEGKVVWAEFRV